MNRSASKPDLELLKSLKETVCDLGDYPEELAKQRSLRSLDIRRVIPRSSSSFSQSNTSFHHSGSIPKHCTFSKNSKIIISGNEIYERFDSRIPASIKEISSMISEIPSEKLPSLSSTFQLPCSDHTFSDNIMWSLSTSDLGLSFDVLMSLSILVFHISPIENLFDEGLVLILIDFLSQQKEKGLIIVSCRVISAAAMCSPYACDSFICFGLPDIISKYLLETSDFDIIGTFLTTLCVTIDGCNECEVTSFQCLIQPLISLIDSPLTSLAISTLASLTGRNSAFVEILHSNGLYSKIFPLFCSGNSNILQPTLKLAGNLSFGSPSSAQELIDNGLIECLLEQISDLESSECSIAMWVLSNFIEMVAPYVLPHIPQLLIGTTIDGCLSGSFDVKRESAYLIATIIRFVKDDQVEFFVNDRIVDALAEMMGCGIHSVTLQCEQAVIRLIDWAEMKGNSYKTTVASLLVESDIEERIEEILGTPENEVNGDEKYFEFPAIIQAFIKSSTQN